MKLVIFEDDQFEQFYPLAYVRGIFDLKTGATTLGEKIARASGTGVDAVLLRSLLTAVTSEAHPGVAVNDLSGCQGQEVLFVNARVCGIGWSVPTEPDAQWKDDRLAVWRTREDVTKIADYTALAEAARSAPRAEFEGTWFGYIWDLMLANPEMIVADFEAADRSGIEGEMHPQAAVFGPDRRLYVGPGARVHPFVCIDTHQGPVTLEEGVEVHPFTRIEGPCYVGRDSILLGAKVREGCSIGPMCRVGGEIEESILHGYSNKYHDGFLGHSYVGEWVNLGALTTNSDLKNDYTGVSVKIGKRTIDTGSPKVGSFIGDHVKTSIGTLLNTGTFVGTMALLMATGSPLPKTIPAFSWYLNATFSKGFGLEALLKTARTTTARRGRPLTESDESVLRDVHGQTKPERDETIRRARRIAASRQGT